MRTSDERFSRQTRLGEVGARGQARLTAAEVSLGELEELALAREYLRRAGVRSVRSASEPAPAFPHGRHFRLAACREVAHAAWLALDQIRRTLDH